MVQVAIPTKNLFVVSIFKWRSGRGRVSCKSLASCSSQTEPVMTVAILATSGMERRDLLIATAKLQLFQGQESISGIAAAAIKNVVWHCLSMKKVVWQMPHQPYRFRHPCRGYHLSRKWTKQCTFLMGTATSKKVKVNLFVLIVDFETLE